MNGALKLPTTNVASRRHGFWAGPEYEEAERVFELCLRAGMTVARSFVVAHIASFENGWIFTSTLAKICRLSRRTVFRAIAEARRLGILGTGRNKHGVRPPHAKGPIRCGYSNRWIYGRGLSIEARAPQIGGARVRWMKSFLARTHKPKSLRELAAREPQRRSPPSGMTTVEWLDAELAKQRGPP